MEITGKIYRIFPPITGEGRNGPWKKQEFLLETLDQFPRRILFSTWGDRVDFSRFYEQQIVKVYFDIESREYNGKYYTDCRCWRVEPEGVPMAASGAQAGYGVGSAVATGSPAPSVQPETEPMAYDDDLPF
ncbi:MAG: DUF3127 domain-containing protein [Flavobacteriales bacterium]|nr:DUF3127 domain-containing protein [Flavobacteriales bacterium]